MSEEPSELPFARADATRSNEAQTAAAAVAAAVVAATIAGSASAEWQPSRVRERIGSQVSTNAAGHRRAPVGSNGGSQEELLLPAPHGRTSSALTGASSASSSVSLRPRVLPDLPLARATTTASSVGASGEGSGSGAAAAAAAPVDEPAVSLRRSLADMLKSRRRSSVMSGGAAAAAVAAAVAPAPSPAVDDLGESRSAFPSQTIGISLTLPPFAACCAVFTCAADAVSGTTEAGATSPRGVRGFLTGIKNRFRRFVSSCRPHFCV